MWGMGSVGYGKCWVWGVLGMGSEALTFPCRGK